MSLNQDDGLEEKLFTGNNGSYIQRNQTEHKVVSDFRGQIVSCSFSAALEAEVGVWVQPVLQIDSSTSFVNGNRGVVMQQWSYFVVLHDGQSLLFQGLNFLPLIR
jgi:hypothetical protein